MTMFCYQCQETTKGQACTSLGVCGKTPDISAIQDLLLYVTKGIAVYNIALQKQYKRSHGADKFVIEALFMTITNANFNFNQLSQKITEGLAIKAFLADQVDSDITNWPDECLWQAEEQDYLAKAVIASVIRDENADIQSLKELIHYGIKGMAAYLYHAIHLNEENQSITLFIQHALAEITRRTISIEELFNLTMETGKVGVEAMALLDYANTNHFGHPQLTKVNLDVGKQPGILVSGHDLLDLEELLFQTDGLGIDIYTHCEMLPAHYYPALKRYSHLVGNYGGAWWQQKSDFKTFNGPILFTTNCIVPPTDKANYRNKLFTTGAAGLTGAIHIPESSNGKSKDFSPIITIAKQCKPPIAVEQGWLTGGFAHNQLLALTDKIVEAVISGKIRKFVVMAGCDGRMKSRYYYTEFAQALTKDTVILTAGCAKYRYNKLNLGDIDGIPRVLDAGQCNDCYSLVIIALKLKEIFKFDDINQLPIIFNIAWYEQKAVIVLLALLYLGIKNIHLGPTLPAFLSENILNILIDKFGLSGISNVKNDMEILFSKV